MMIKRMLVGFLVLLIVFQTGCTSELVMTKGQESFREKGVSITDSGDYFNVAVDFSGGMTHRQMGEALARGILAVAPDYEALVDLYLTENLAKYEYNDALLRVEDIKTQLNREYVDEMDGMSMVFSGGTDNRYNDGKISRDEVYLFNLLPDAIRGSQCSFVSVFGSRSATGRTITGRNLDWYSGKINQLPRLQSVTTFNYGNRKLCSIGYLGFLGIITGFNDSKVFAAILDSSTGAPYTSLGKRSYPLDLRFALENKTTLDGAAEYMADPSKLYAVNHIIGFSDSEGSKVLENNISGTGATGQRVRRALRSADSRLNKDITWGIGDAIGCVNSFLLYGNFDNHTSNKYNTRRWKNMKGQLLAMGPSVTAEEMKNVIAYNHGSPGTFMDSGDLYNKMTLQMIVFQPDSLTLEIAFRSRNTRKAPEKPVFEEIPVFR